MHTDACSIRRMRVKPLLAVGLVLLSVSRAAGQEPSRPGGEGCLAPSASEAVRLAGLDAHGDLLLADGRVLRLAGLMPRQDEADRARFAGAMAPFIGRGMRLVGLGGVDRWRRLPARLIVEAPDGSPAEMSDLAALLLALGAALRLPEPGQPDCNEAWRLAERQGRPSAAQRASATTAGAPVLDGHDPAAIKAQAGRIVVVEGRIASVGERSRRSYLNFSRRRGAGASIMLSRRLWREMQDAGWTASTLPGKRVRVRGVVEGRDSLLIEPDSRAALEMID